MSESHETCHGNPALSGRCWVSDHYHMRPETGHLVHFGDEWCDGWTYEDWKEYTREKHPDLFEPVPRGRMRRQRQKLADQWLHIVIRREWENNSAAGKAGY